MIADIVGSLVKLLPEENLFDIKELLVTSMYQVVSAGNVLYPVSDPLKTISGMPVLVGVPNDDAVTEFAPDVLDIILILVIKLASVPKSVPVKVRVPPSSSPPNVNVVPEATASASADIVITPFEVLSSLGVVISVIVVPEGMLSPVIV